MHRIKLVLVPTDFSPTAGHAYQYATQLCSRLGAALTVLHVIPPVHYVEVADAVLLAREAQEGARNLLATLKPKPQRTLIQNGVPHDVIVTAARSLHADLIVMGTHGRSGLQRLVLGSVAENVVRHAPCPVLTVPGRK